jgi:hypothetical protein
MMEVVGEGELERFMTQLAGMHDVAWSMVWRARL